MFNIALKRLAKIGNPNGCEGILVDMLNEGLESKEPNYNTCNMALAVYLNGKLENIFLGVKITKQARWKILRRRSHVDSRAR